MAQDVMASPRSRALNVQAVTGWYREALARALLAQGVPTQLREDIRVQLEIVDVFRQQLHTFQSLSLLPPKPVLDIDES